MTFNSIFLLSDCWHESEYEENPSVQSVYIEMPQARTPKEGLLTGKTALWHLSSYLDKRFATEWPTRTKLVLCRGMFNPPGPKASQCQDPIKGRGGQWPLMKNCIVHVSGNPVTDRKIRKDFTARWELLRYQKRPKDEKLNEITKSPL